MNVNASDLDGENPGVMLANELGVDMDELHRRLKERETGERGCLTISIVEAAFLKACMEVACGY